MIQEQLLRKARAEFDRLVAEREAAFREEFRAKGRTDAEIDAIFEANQPNIRRAWREVHRQVVIRALEIEGLDG